MPEPLPRSTTVSPPRMAVEVVADAREGFDRLVWDGVEFGGRVAEPLGERATDPKVEVFVRFVGDFAVDLLDAPLEVPRVERPRLCGHLVPLCVRVRPSR
jgi:hypothetical protein